MGLPIYLQGKELWGCIDVSETKPCKIAREMWDYVKNIYQQGNVARQFQLELDISQFTQGALSIQEYYNGF